MRVLKFCLMMLSLGAFILSSPLNAKADEWNKAITLTFSRPVEVPGMVLGPGTYLFKLADTVDRHVVQIYNADESHLYEDVLAIPAYREQATDNTVVTLEERAKGAPEAVGTWFYPGDNYGQEFVYPKAIAEVASATPVQPVAPLAARSKPAPPQQQIQKTAVQQATATTASKPQQIQLAQATTPPEPAATPTKATPPAQKQAPAKLPKTASPVPTLVLIGLLSLGASASIRVFTKQSV